MKKKRKKNKKVKKPRDLTILAAFKKEINLSTSSHEVKTKYKRKQKYNNQEDY